MSTRNLALERVVRAASPAAEKTVVHTGGEGLDIARVPITVAGDEVILYTARPAGGTNLPVVIVLTEAFGMHPYIEDVTRRFAHEGYLAVTPDLMARQGDAAAFVDDVDRLVSELLQHIPDEQVMADIDAAVKWAVANGGDSTRVGVNGFSWGGRWAWLHAAHARLNAAVSWYGVLDDASSGLYPGRELFPRHPIDLAAELKTPVLGLYAEKDAVIPVAGVTGMKAALEARPADAPEVEFTVYPGAVHGFHADYRDDYSPVAAPDGWQRALGWLRRHGV
ncbi:dienelactone hydrolase family protein [Streptomyces sp. NBC_00872]|uniref:dienelactone hydrolase family protein n=1 Tax=Streptomyces sp. NBC_00872 TaxID=2903686 RepID=UPI003863C326|nr:dienelactone hydrolase family protein [Streptomyces sp. NBC_00872]